MRHALVALSIAVVAIPARAQTGPSAALEAPRRGLDLAGMDRTVRPGDDFNAFANGEWQRKTTVPADRPSWGTGATMNNKVREDLRALLNESLNAPAGTVAGRVGAFYASALDTARMDQRGLSPIKPWLDSIDRARTFDDLLRLEAMHQHWLGPTFISLLVGEGFIDPTINIIYTWQAPLGLPDARYYTASDSANVKLRERYRVYMAALLTLSGIPANEAAALADRQLEFETALAAKSRDATALRDLARMNNPRTVADLGRSYPRLALDRRLAQAGFRADTILVTIPENLSGIDSLLGATDLATLKTRYRLRALQTWAPHLSKPFRSVAFAWTGRALAGTTEPLPRWQQATAIVDENAGELVGRLYVERHFTPVARARVDELVGNLKAALRARLEANEWMAPTTRAEALKKLDGVHLLLGYPDKWETYEGLTLDRTDLVGNIAGARWWLRQRDRRRAGKPVNVRDWAGTPATVDAWANPNLNAITFPAGILQPPMFDVDADDALNYGGIGMVIGHEIVHLFDDQGRLFDSRGAMRDWWTPADAAAFKQRTDRLVAQFNDYTVLDGLHINGQLTLGENTADVGGLLIAYEAFKRTPQGKSSVMKDGFTPDQRFFLAHAQNWRRVTRDNALRLLVQADPHSPAHLRVNGPLSNLDAFYAAFDVKPGDKMYRAPQDRARIW